MKISLDVEGTLADIFEPTSELITEEKGHVNFNDMSWDLDSVEGIEIEDYLEHSKRVWKNRWDTIPPTEDTITSAARKLNNNHHVDIVTSRRNCEKEMRAWLDEYNIEYSHFLVVDNKAALSYDVYIDDNPSLVDNTSKVMLYDQPWNREINREDIICRIGKELSLEGAADLLSGQDLLI